LISKHKKAQPYLPDVREQTITHENEPHWFSHIKQACLSFCLPQLMYELMNV